MGKKTPSAPAPPDPVATANAQSAANVATAEAQARLNRINEITPFGSVRYARGTPSAGGGVVQPTGVSSADMTAYNEALAKWNAAGEQQQGALLGYDYGGGPPRPRYDVAPSVTRGPMPVAPTAAAGGTGGSVDDTWTRITELTPAQQRSLDLSQGLSEDLTRLAGENIGRVRTAQAMPFGLEGLPPLPNLDDASRKRVEEALFSRLEPQFSRDRENLEARLINQGFARGSEAWNSAIDEFNRAQTDARFGVTTRGLGEQQAQFQMAQALRGQALTERAYERAFPVNEIATLLGTAGPIQGPNFGGVPQVGVQPTDVTGPIYANYQGQLSNYNQNLASQNAERGAIFGLLGAGAGAALGSPWLGSALGVKQAAPMFFGSDPKSKTDKRAVAPARVLDEVEDLPIESWRYKGDSERRTGPYADDWAKSFGGDGKVIPMPQAFGVTLAAIKALADKVGRLERRAA